MESHPATVLSDVDHELWTDGTRDGVRGGGDVVESGTAARKGMH